MPLIALRVVCGVEAVMLTFISQIVFTSVDFPTLGRPIRDTLAQRVKAALSSLSIGFPLYCQA